MAKTDNTNLGSSILKFTFTDDDGDVVASFRLNPADVRLASRFAEAAKSFANLAKEAPAEATAEATAEDVLRYNDAVEEKICYVLGYDAHESLFGFMSATTILDDGEMFAQKVMKKIEEAVLPEVRKRKEALMANVRKHTAKYE